MFHDTGLPVDAEAGGTCTRHLYKAENVGFGYDGRADWGDIILKGNIKIEFEDYKNCTTVYKIQFLNLAYCKFLNLCYCR